MRAYVHIMSSSTLNMVTFMACADQLSTNLTDLLQLLGASLDLGPNKHGL